MNDIDDGQGDTSTSMLRRIQAGNQTAWDKFAVIYGPLVYSWARKFGLQSQDALDIGQEVFWSVAIAIGDFERSKTGGFRGWLWTITQNKVRDHFRRLKNQPAQAVGSDALRMQELPEVPHDDPEIRTRELGRISHRTLQQVKGEFEEKTWKMFWRNTVDGDSAEDVASDFGVTKWTVYKSRTRILRRLRQELADFMD